MSSRVKPEAQEDKDGESVFDSLGRAQEPLPDPTFSLKNNAAGLSSDERENPLNGTQPNPFVYSSVPAVPHAGNSLPSGALVNGPGSHPTSEVHCVLNKGAVLSNNVLDAAWQAEKDTSLEVLRPPSGLQSDAWKNAAGPAAKTPATQPGVNAPLSHSEENESKLAYSAGGGRGRCLSRPPSKRTIRARSRRGAERPEGRPRDSPRVAEWDDGRLGAAVAQQVDGNDDFNPTRSRDDAGVVDAANKDDSLGAESEVKHPAVPFQTLSGNSAVDSQPRIHCSAQRGRNERDDPENEDSFCPKVEQPKTELFFSCPICNVNFREKRRLHRRVMYHLGEHNQVNGESASQPVACGECGRLFCDRRLVIHHDGLQDLREEIKGPKNRESEDGAAIGSNDSEIFVQHAKTHDNLKHYYFCEECNYITLTQQALEAHLHVAHLDAQQPPCRRASPSKGAEGAGRVPLRCKMAFFASADRAALKRRNYKRLSDQSPIPGLQPVPSSGNAASFPISKNGVARIRKSKDDAADPSQLERRSRKPALPSLWKIDKHRKLLLQPAEKLDVATDLTCVEEDAENNDCGAFGSPKQANRAAAADFSLSARNLKLDQMFCQRSKNDPASEALQVRANQRSPSMSKMSTPLHNTIDSMNGNILPKHRQRLKKEFAVRELVKGCGGSSNFSEDTSEATGSFLESGSHERNGCARGCYTERQRFAGKDQSPHELKEEQDGDEDCSDIEQLVIKEEHAEATVCADSPEPPRAPPASDSLDAGAGEPKPCPYCPAAFKSGVGLSNHVRGHLHRVGLSYNARHTVSPEEVALGDRRPKARRRISTGTRRMRKVFKADDQSEYPCPLCWGWFDSKTGLSNHVRGHLKRIGGSVTSTGRSPLGILHELLRDKTANRAILQTLQKNQFPPRLFVSQRFISSSGLFRVHAGVPVETKFGPRNPYPILDSFVPKQEAEAISERRKLQVEAQRCPKATSSTLVELLKMRQESVELTATSNQRAYATRRLCDITKDYKETKEMGGGGDLKRIYLRCNSSFPAAVGLSGDLHYAHRRSSALLEEPGYDYKRKKPRPRPGLKRRILPSLNAEIYTLTCRFCDLVFQGPLSVQEDWIKHLQRHLVHTSVPHSGTGMVEVLGIDVSHEDLGYV